MDASSKNKQANKNNSETTTFPVPLNVGEIQRNIIITTRPSFEEKIVNEAIKFHLKGEIENASRCYQYCISKGINDHRVFSNYGGILKDLGKLKKAEILLLKAIESNPNCTQAYYSLSVLKYSNDNKTWQDKLFSESILKHKLQTELVEIYFARANILHNEKNYQESARQLQLANKISLSLKKSTSNQLIYKSKVLLSKSLKKSIYYKEYKQYPENIFIVGMPRSGSTLLESILSTNPIVDDLGEINILEESFLEWEKDIQGLTLSEIYWRKVTSQKSKVNITTNKWLYNYQYAGIISNQIANAKIIHCYRNPLDNILSIYRAYLAKGNEYSSSLVDCTNVYLDQDKIMNTYKNRFDSKIYSLNYDLLVNNPNQEIKSLISWLGWKWDDRYLSPHLNPRSISTASSVQVRFPINSNSIGGWKNYKDMLKPAIEILTKTDKYKDLTS